jgi:prepilin peptidase CpaA
VVSTSLFVLTVLSYTLAAAFTDLRQRRIPNALTVPTAVAGLLFHTFAPGGWGPSTALLGFAIGFGLLFLPWCFGGGGMGDVKLLAALGAWFGPHWMLIAFALGIALAAALALGVIAVHTVSTSLAPLDSNSASAAIDVPTARMLPFAVPVAIGAWMIVFWLVHQGVLAM